MRASMRLRTAVILAVTAALAAPAAAQATSYEGPYGPKDVHGAIEQEYLHLNAGGGFKPGRPLTDEAPTPTKQGAFNDFERGAIYWSPSSNAHEVHGAFYGFWAGQGWENGPMGFPVTDEFAATGGVGQRFQGTALYWSPRSGAHSIDGDFYALWDAHGWERGPLGFPAGERSGAAAGGTFQRFTGGAIYDQANPYIDPVSVSGAFYGYWAAQGYERGRLGYPLGEENATASYPYGTLVFQVYSGGTLYWTPSTGVTERYPGS